MLGFGMRCLPRMSKKPARINEDEAARMLRYAINHGVNYLDLPYFHNTGQRENLLKFVGGTLQGGYREKIKIAASLPAVLINSGQDFESYLNRQLRLLRTDRLDFFLIGGLDRKTWPKLPIKEIFIQIETAMARGRLSYSGFSFHDDFQTLRTVVDAYDNWTLGQFQYSFMDIDHHPGVGGIKYAASKRLAVVITEPLKRGRLTRGLPATIARIWAGAPQYTPAGWGLRFVWNHPEVATVVSDMSNIAEVRRNISLADSADADSLTVPEELVINRVRDAYHNLKPIPCTACAGCMPCPLDIDVPRIFELYNDAIVYDNPEIPRTLYHEEGHRIGDCIECGLCVKACGRQIPITEWLRKASQLLAEEA